MVVIRRKHTGRSPVPVEDAPLAVEVVSPTSTFRDMYDKAKVYVHAGVRSYWVVDPLQERVTLTADHPEERPARPRQGVIG